MAYGNYLRQQSSECIRLAVEQPWSDDAENLIDLARDYSSMASSFDRRTFDGAYPGAQGEAPGQARLFGWLTMHPFDVEVHNLGGVGNKEGGK